MKHRLNVRPDAKDSRDHMAAPAPPGVVLPATVDLRQWMPPVRDQGNAGGCTMFAGTAILSWLYKRFNNQDLVFSPQFGYRAERIIEGDRDQDAGAQSRTMMAVMHDVGICLEASDPYVDSGWGNATTMTMLAEAAKYKIGAYHRIVYRDTMKSVLASGYVASIAIEIFPSFETDEVAATGIVPMPKKGESPIGAHEVCVVGYNPAGFIVRNSWGQDWGFEGGYFRLPYGYWNYVYDSWTAHLGAPWQGKLKG